MKNRNRNRIVGIGSLGAAVLTALSALAASYYGYGVSGLSPASSSGATATSAIGVAAAAQNAQAQNDKKILPPKGMAKQDGFDRFIVKYRNGTTEARSADAMLASIQGVAMRAGVAGIAVQGNGVRGALQLQRVRRLGMGADLVKLSRKLSQAEADALLQQLRADPSVEFAQPDYLKQAQAVPNDTYYNLQWHYSDPAAGIQAPAAWDLSDGSGVVVAVLDTGYLDHADLAANIVPGYDFIVDTAVAGDGDGRDADAHDPGDWYTSNSSFHGTHVAGTVAAVTNNAKGVAGVAYNARVQPVRVLGHGGGYTSDIADAIIWASGGSVAGVPANPTPAEVINMSLGGNGSCAGDPVTQAAIDGAIGRGTTIVVSAGNDDANADNYSPAGCRGVITVGANGIDGARSWFSNYGASVAISAPGGNATSGSDPNDRWIWSLGNSGTTTPVASPEGDRVVGMIGTSMASPHVAAVVALMQSAAVAAGRPALTPAQVKTLLKSTANPFLVMPPVNKPQGAGIVNAAAAVQAAMQDIPVDQGELLSNRVVFSGQLGSAGESHLYRIEVPAGKTSLNLRTYGGTGDVSMYVAYDRVPTATSYDRKSAKPGNSETVAYTRPVAGTYYLLVVGETPFTNVSVLGVY